MADDYDVQFRPREVIERRLLASLRRLARHRGNVSSGDAVVEAVVAKLRTRSEVGVKKYGVTLERTDWTRLDRLNHALEEALDLANYLAAEVVAEEDRLLADEGKSQND